MIESVVHTKDRILDAAESLFGGQGFSATSLRQITSKAGVNLAAVNYHFQTKESLIEAVIHRKLAPLNRRRIELLDRYEAEAGGGALTLEQVLQAFLSPVFEARRESRDLTDLPRIMGRIYVEPGDYVPRIMSGPFREVVQRFLPAFQRAMGGVSREEAAWGAHFTVGVMAHFLAAPGLLVMLSGGELNAAVSDEAEARMIQYTAGGLRGLAARGSTEAL